MAGVSGREGEGEKRKGGRGVNKFTASIAGVKNWGRPKIFEWTGVIPFDFVAQLTRSFDFITKHFKAKGQVRPQFRTCSHTGDSIVVDLLHVTIKFVSLKNIKKMLGDNPVIDSYPIQGRVVQSRVKLTQG